MLQTRTIEPRTLGLLKELMSLPMLNSFYLVGGTALALQLGFEDAENNADPIVFDKEIAWQKVKTEIVKVVKLLK